MRQASAPKLEEFVVARIRDIGRDSAMLEEVLVAIEAEREQQKPHLEKEQRMLAVELAGCTLPCRRSGALLVGPFSAEPACWRLNPEAPRLTVHSTLSFPSGPSWLSQSIKLDADIISLASTCSL